MTTAYSLNKIHNTGFLLVLYFLLASVKLQAQVLPPQPDTAAAFSNVGMGLPGAAAVVARRRMVLSPVAKGAAMLAAGAGIWVATFAWGDEPVQQYTQSHRTLTSNTISSVVQPLGRQGYMAPLAGAAFAGGVLLKDEKLQKAGLLSLGSILISAGVTGTLKNEFHRYRPSDTAENHYFDGPHASIHTSLPSAHTATAFAVATSVATVYGPEYRYVPPLAYGVATLVGLSRIHDNAHWTTDVMAGAVVGYLSAKGANYLYDMANQQWRIRKQRRLLITPQPGLRSGGVSATLVF